jgi:hypothetical protein
MKNLNLTGNEFTADVGLDPDCVVGNTSIKSRVNLCSLVPTPNLLKAVYPNAYMLQ